MTKLIQDKEESINFQFFCRLLKQKLVKAKECTALSLDKSLYKGVKGDEIWAAMGLMVLNMRKLLRDIKKSPKLMNRLLILPMYLKKL